MMKRSWWIRLLCLAVASGLAGGVSRVEGAIRADGVFQADGFVVGEDDLFHRISIGNRLSGSVISITGGEVHELVAFILRSTIHISGGRVGSIWFTKPIGRVDPHAPRTVVNITGGEVDFLEQFGDVGSYLSGGHTERLLVHSSSWSEVTGGSIGTLEATGGGLVTVFGHDFNFPIGDIIPTSGTLTGVLQDGSALQLPFTRDELSTIRLVPEPGGLGVVILGITLLARRRTMGT